MDEEKLVIIDPDILDNGTMALPRFVKNAKNRRSARHRTHSEFPNKIPKSKLNSYFEVYNR